MDERAILTFWSFNELFEKEIKTGCPYYEAYNHIEQYHEVKYGQRRYNSYDAFRMARTRSLKKC